MTTIVAVKVSEGVALAADKRASKGFFVGSKATRKIYKVDENAAVAIAGQLSDAEHLVNTVRAERNLLALQRGYVLSISETAKLLSNLAYSGMRSYAPYLVELLVAGKDEEGFHVFSADMSGAVTSEDFMSSGSGSPIAYGVLESGYMERMSLKEALDLAQKAVMAAMERDPGSGNGIDVLSIPDIKRKAEEPLLRSR
jgi:proteasome beta subunit